MSQHVVSIKSYLLVFAGLIALTIITTAVAFVNLGPFSVVAALGIATCKMLLVALWFMHVKDSDRLIKLVVIGALFWLGILLLFTLSDYATRNIMGVPGK